MRRSYSRNANCSKSYFKKKLDYYKKTIEADEIAQNNALIGFYYRVNPDKLTDSQWAKKVIELQWVLKYNGTLVPKE